MPGEATYRPSTSTKTISGGATILESSYRTSKTQETVIHELTDNGTGGFGAYGAVNYSGKTLTVRLVDLNSKSEGYNSDHEKDDAFTQGEGGGSTSIKGAEYSTSAISEEILAASTVTVTYAKDFNVEIAASVGFRPPSVSIDLCPYTSDYIVPGSVQFTWMGEIFADYDGILFRGRTALSGGFVAGQINYSEGTAQVTDYVVRGLATDFTLNSCWTVRQSWTTASIFMRTQASPIKPSGFVMSLVDAKGAEIVATGDLHGAITGSHLKGHIDYATGEVELQFGDYVLDTALTEAQKSEWWYSADEVGSVVAGKVWRPWPVDPSTLRYNSVAYFYLPLDASILGLDPVRLPPDGRVSIFSPGGFVVVGHTASVTATVFSGQVVNCARTRLSRVRIIDRNGRVINAGYTANLEAGLVTFVETSSYQQPIKIENRIEDMAVISDVQITGVLGLTRQLTHDYPLGSYVSSALVAKDLKARVSVFFDQLTWGGNTWSDSIIGEPAVGTYNNILSPIVVTNVGALTERWCLRFTSSSSYQVIGEHVGVIGIGNINTIASPINPATDEPYFTLEPLGWGLGWAAGNILRFNTVGALFQVWCVRTIQQGAESLQDDSFTLLVRGDVDRP